MKPWFKITKPEGVLYVELITEPTRLSDRRRLEMSIEKFRALCEAVTPKTTHIHVGSDTCPLCWKYAKINCVGCPIYYYTRNFGCCGTPFEQVIKATSANEIKVALNAEITFLEEVLKNNTRKGKKK